MEEPEGRESVEGARRVIDAFAALDDDAKRAFFPPIWRRRWTLTVDALGAAVRAVSRGAQPRRYGALAAAAEPRARRWRAG